MRRVQQAFVDQAQRKRAPASTCVLVDRMDFYEQNWADGSYSCGYRNIQMLCSALLARPAEYGGVSFFGGMAAPPPLPCIQEAIEHAWRQGYDPVGADQLGHRLKGFFFSVKAVMVIKGEIAILMIETY